MERTMPPSLTPEDIDQLARKRASAKLGWYSHAVVYVLVNAGLFALSSHAFGTRAWSPAPLLGWGLGLVLHGISVWFVGAGSSLRERMVQRERERLLQQQDLW
jgi:hypothetical protein